MSNNITSPNVNIGYVTTTNAPPTYVTANTSSYINSFGSYDEETKTRMQNLLEDDALTAFDNGRISKIATGEEISNMRILAKFGIPYHQSTTVGILFAADIYDQISALEKELPDCKIGSRCEFYCVVKDKNDPDSKVVSTGFDYKIFSGENRTTITIKFNTKNKTVEITGQKQKPLGQGGDDPLFTVFGEKKPFDKKNPSELIPWIVENARRILTMGETAQKKELVQSMADFL